MIFCLLIAGCTAISDQELADLQSANVVAKQEALLRICKGPGFPLKYMGPLLDRDNEKKAVNILVQLLPGEQESKEVELAMIRTLGYLGKITEVPTSSLIDKLGDDDPEIRSEAIQAVAEIQSQEALPALYKLLDSGRNRYAVIWALGEIGGPTAIPMLSKLLASADDYERYNARIALGKIGGGEQTGSTPGDAPLVVSQKPKEDIQINQVPNKTVPDKAVEKTVSDKAVQGAISIPPEAKPSEESQPREFQPMPRSIQKTPEPLALVMAQRPVNPQTPRAEKKIVYDRMRARVESEAKEQKVETASGPGEENISEDAAALYLQGLALQRDGDFEEAKQWYQAALKVAPNMASAWNNMGTIYMKEKNYGSAIIALQKALRMTPKNADPYYNLACLYALQRNVSQSLSYLRKAVSVDEEVRNWAVTDEDLKNVRSHSEFQEIIQNTRSS